MRNVATTTAAVSCFTLTACAPAGGVTADRNLECAALIGAATVLISSGKAEHDPALMKRALVSSMTHLNAYAIPKRLKEAEAFAEVKSLRQTLIETLPTAEIMRRAKRCTDRNPV